MMNDQDRLLSTALMDLAGTMPDDPHRLDAIHARLDRNRRRRRVGHAAVGASIVVLTVATVGLLRPAAPSVSTVPATQPTPAAEPALPACAAVPPPPVPAAGDANQAAESAKAAAQGAKGQSPAAGTPNGAEASTEGVKGSGTVVTTTDASITIAVLDPDPGQPAEVTAAFTDETLLYDGDAVMTTRPTPGSGDRVGFAVARNGGRGYDLLFLQVHPIGTPIDSGTAVDQAKADEKLASALGGATSGATKNLAEIVSAQPGSLTLELRSDPLVGQTITAKLAPDIVYLAGEQQCVDPVLAPGGVVLVLLVPGTGGSYTIDRLALFTP